MSAVLRRVLPCWALSALAGVLPAASAADLTIMPVAVQLDSAHDRTTVRVTNQGKEPVVLQADAIGWAREGGVDRDTVSNDLIVNPPIFTVAPGQTQVVRVGLRRNSPGETESTYRMVLREVPTAETDAGTLQGQVRVLVALRVPVYVAPSVVRREQRWAARYDGAGNLVAAVTNTGNVHYKIGSMHVASEDLSSTRKPQGPDSVVMPGEARTFVLRAPVVAATAAKPLTLEVQTDHGMQYVALDVARN